MNLSQRFLIAEIGINHNGDFNRASKLIQEASKVGVNAVKFQYRNLSRSYGTNSNEIGDEIIKAELQRTYLSPTQIIELLNLAKDLNLSVGISFFDKDDVDDFKSEIFKFDFFKIPSVELSNLPLINTLTQFDKLVLISTGAHDEHKVEEIFNQIEKKNWIPLHCVSNYPTININARLGYIEYLTKKWGKQAGYSSHDANWEVCLFAISLGVRIIERHITLDKSDLGLDHSTSSTPEEFAKISKFMDDFEKIILGNAPRELNQGELINLQNLSKSYFANIDVPAGQKIDLRKFEYRHPRIGLSTNEITGYLDRIMLQPCKTGDPLTAAHFRPRKRLESDIFAICNKLEISLPIRFHDYKAIQDNFALNNFELHLSANDVNKLKDFQILSPHHKFSIHLPDYQSSMKLFNPFSVDVEDRAHARSILDSVISFGLNLTKTQTQPIVIVASMTQLQLSKSEFYEECRQLQDEMSSYGLILAYQWMPPFAWYFGGSEKIEVFNTIEDLVFIKELNLAICLDTSHLLMSSKYYRYDPTYVLKKLESQIVHFHISDAKGFDGEGIQIGEGDEMNLEFLRNILNYPNRKVVEVWQGHLNLFEGFYDALEIITELSNG